MDDALELAAAALLRDPDGHGLRLGLKPSTN
jgi:hypothetical protein